jgi:hypothetical protein
MSIKYSKWSFFQSKSLQNLPKVGFWFEIKPSGNPETQGPERLNMLIQVTETFPH